MNAEKRSKINEFVVACEKIIGQKMDYDISRKYIRVYSGIPKKYLFCLISENGNILQPTTKKVRGNLYDENFGLKNIDERGLKSLKPGRKKGEKKGELS